MRKIECKTFWVKIYSSGPIDVAKNIIRVDVLLKGLCVTIDPTVYIYTGGEETGFVVGLLNYPRFKTKKNEILKRSLCLALKLLNGCFQRSILIETPEKTIWITKGRKNDNKINNTFI